MAVSAPMSHVVLVITAAVLFYVALTDFKHFKIRNELILVLAGLFVVPRFCPAVGRAHTGTWPSLSSCSALCCISIRRT